MSRKYPNAHRKSNKILSDVGHNPAGIYLFRVKNIDWENVRRVFSELQVKKLLIFQILGAI